MCEHDGNPPFDDGEKLYGGADVPYDEDETLVFLTEQTPPWSDMLADVLRQHDIPFLTTPVMGAGMTLYVGSMLERVSFAVPGSFLRRALALVEELFSGEPAIEP